MQKKTLNEIVNQIQSNVHNHDYTSCVEVLINAIEQYPNENKLKLNLANIYKILGDATNAKNIYMSLLKTEYKSIAYNNLSLIYLEQGDVGKSIEHAQKALRYENNYSDAKFNLALGLFENKEFLESLNICKDLVDHDGYKHKANELQIRIQQIICDWSRYKETQRLLESNQITVHPFLHISHVMNEEKNYINAKKWSAQTYNDEQSNKITHSSKTIKLGFLCGEIRNHPTFNLIKNFFRHIDKDIFSMYIFSYDHDVYEKKYIENDFEEFIDITNLNSFEAKENIKKYNLDILIDLTTIISHNRIDIIDRDVAKKIIAYLAFPGTTGNVVYDYILTDKVVTPEIQQKYYEETFLYLPTTYQINNGEINIDINNMRQDNNLPKDKIILGCLNQSFKLDPLLFNTWIEILESNRNTCLWILDEGEEMKRNIVNFVNNRIETNRIIFAEKLSYKEHLMRIQHIDLALDTRIYNGHTTTIEMLQAGVPVITLKGNHFASRVSASILNAFGMSELIATSMNEYKERIIDTTKSIENINSLKKRVENNLKNSKLLNLKSFAEEFEKTILSIMT